MLTRRLLTAGAFVAGLSLAIALAFRLAGLGGAATLSALATAGVLVLLATPAIGLLATFVELRAAGERRAWLALAVLGVLASAVAVAITFS